MNIISIADENYNTSHKKTRTIIEVSGMRKCETVVASQNINTCCVLHNLCVENRINTPSKVINDDPSEDGMFVNRYESGLDIRKS